ncbi:MAG: FGGY family carbohydrate kinase [Hyphomicrobiaceae bacterium]
MPYLLGLDIGTTSTIGILIDAEGATLAVESRPATLHSDHAGWAEEETGEWWGNVGEIARALLSRSGLSPRDITGVGITGMLPTVILVDRDGRALRRSIQQNDARATAELESFRAGMQEDEFLALTGTGYSQQLVGPKLMWLRRREPEIWRQTQCVLGASDYITAALTGTRQVEHNWALESGLVNISTGAYDERLLALADLDPRFLAPIRRSHEVVGGITAAAADHTGLAPGTPVVAGCADHVASAFVCGASRNGDLVVKFGGAGDILLSSDRPVADRRLFIDHHIVPGLWFPNGCMAASGSLLNWVVRNWGSGEAEAARKAGVGAHQWLDGLAARVPATSPLLMLPYVLGEKTPLMDPYARGTLVGLGLNHGMPEIWRAALEAVVFGFRHHTEVLGEAGLEVTRIFAADGGARSDLWLQITADALGRPVTRIDRHPGSCLGAAFVAGIGIGAIADWTAISKYVRQGRTFEPEPAAASALDRKYALWRDTYRRLKDLFPSLAALEGA